MIRICKINYYPKEYSYKDGDRLNVYIHGVNKGGGFVKKIVLGTEPRFWVKEDPATVLTDIDFHHVAKFDRHGFHKGELLYRIFTYFPWEVPMLRDKFKWTGQADIKYDLAVRWFYGWKHFLKVPVRDKIYVDEIIPLSDEEAAKINRDYPLRKLVLDIECAGGEMAEAKRPSNPIVAISAYDMTNDEVYAAVTKDVSVAEVKAALSSSDWLRNNLLFGVDEMGRIEIPDKIPPLDPSKIHIKVIKAERWDRWEDEEKENRLMKWLVELLEYTKPNIIQGHNLIEFDVAYMRERAKIRRRATAKWNRRDQEIEKRFPMPRIDWERFSLGDSMLYYKQLHEGEMGEKGRAALAWMGIEELGYGKISRPSIEKMYADDVERLVIYNIWDSVLVARCDNLREMTSFHIDKAEFAGSSLEYATKNMVLVESYIAHWHREHNQEIMPSIANIPRTKVNAIEGAFVHKAPSGWFDYVIEFDNKMQYPAIIITCNLDTSTLIEGNDPVTVPHSILPSGRRYVLNPEGPIPNILRGLVLKREAVQAREKECESKNDNQGKLTCKNQNRVLKFFMNSFYGVLASGTTEKTKHRPMRLADHRIGEDITTGAQAVLKWNKDVIENYEYECRINGQIYLLRFKVIYQDTDSCKTIIIDAKKIEKKSGLTFTEELLWKIGKAVAQAVNDSYPRLAKEVFNVSNHAFFVKVDSVAKNYYQWGSKKLYVYSDFKGKITYKGMKIKRSDSTFLEKMFLTEIFESLMKEGSLSSLSKIVRKFNDDVKNGKYKWQTGKSIGISSTGHWAWEACEYSNKFLGKHFKVGESRPVIYFVKAVKNVPQQPLFSSDKSRRVALDWKDNPDDFGLILDYPLIIRKYLDSMAVEKILVPLKTSFKNLRDGGLIQHSWEDYDV